MQTTTVKDLAPQGSQRNATVRVLRGCENNDQAHNVYEFVFIVVGQH
jgi:hypothetical protein